VHLSRIGVVNQTTMLAAETHAIARELRQALIDRYGADAIGEHFADTSDTLCYATNENQNATYALIERGADVGIVVGGYNSSNTSHIVELCERAMPTYFVGGADDILSGERIRHFNLETRDVVTTDGWLPSKRPVEIVLTCGASCPDAILDDVLRRMLSFFDGVRDVEAVLAPYAINDA
jgi:4-hydroxy-3-methylbut-2-enyl diphosphate reductase